MPPQKSSMVGLGAGEGIALVRGFDFCVRLDYPVTCVVSALTGTQIQLEGKDRKWVVQGSKN